MKRKKRAHAMAVLGMAALVTAPFVQPQASSHAMAAYADANAGADQSDDDDDDFNGVRFKLFFPNMLTVAH